MNASLVLPPLPIALSTFDSLRTSRTGRFLQFLRVYTQLLLFSRQDRDLHSTVAFCSIARRVAGVSVVPFAALPRRGAAVPGGEPLPACRRRAPRAIRPEMFEESRSNGSYSVGDERRKTPAEIMDWFHPSRSS